MDAICLSRRCVGQTINQPDWSERDVVGEWGQK